MEDHHITCMVHQITFPLAHHFLISINNNEKINIAIDGHSSCGKSTLAKQSQNILITYMLILVLCIEQFVYLL